MNKARRKVLEELQTKVEELQAEVEQLMSEEDETRENMIDGSEMYERSEEASNCMQDELDSLDEVYQAIEDAISA